MVSYDGTWASMVSEKGFSHNVLSKILLCEVQLEPSYRDVYNKHGEDNPHLSVELEVVKYGMACQMHVLSLMIASCLLGDDCEPPGKTLDAADGQQSRPLSFVDAKKKFNLLQPPLCPLLPTEGANPPHHEHFPQPFSSIVQAFVVQLMTVSSIYCLHLKKSHTPEMKELT